MKRFVSKCLNRACAALTRAKSEKGFTLVELVVVIAILGILAGVGTVGYSGYVKKANMAADQQLVRDVANALQLQYYSDPTNAANDYVILTTRATDAGGTFAEGAMDNAFGAGAWSGFALKYNGWTDGGFMDLVTDYNADTLNSIASSTFVSVSTPESLMSAVTVMTDLVSEVVANSDFTKATERLTLLGMTDAVDKLEEIGLDPNDPEDQQEYSTAVSNLLVSEIAGLLQTGDGSDNLSGLLFVYSSALAYGEATGDYSPLDQVKTNLASDAFTFDVLSSDAWMGVVTDGWFEADGSFKNQDFETFGAQYEANNKSALISMMGAVEQIAGSYTDKESLTNSELFTTGDVAEQVNNYVNAVKVQAGMSQTEREALQSGSVAVYVAKDGTVAVTPYMILSGS